MATPTTQYEILCDMMSIETTAVHAARGRAMARDFREWREHRQWVADVDRAIADYDAETAMIAKEAALEEAALEMGYDELYY